MHDMHGDLQSYLLGTCLFSWNFTNSCSIFVGVEEVCGVSVACREAPTDCLSYQARFKESFKDVSVSTVHVLCLTEIV